MHQPRQTVYHAQADLLGGVVATFLLTGGDITVDLGAAQWVGNQVHNDDRIEAVVDHDAHTISLRIARQSTEKPQCGGRPT